MKAPVLARYVPIAPGDGFLHDNAMNKMLRDCILDITMPFLDNIPIKGCPVEEKDETIGPDGCRKFVATRDQ